MKLTTNVISEDSPEKVHEYLRTFVNSPGSSDTLSSNQNKKPLRDQFTGIEPNFRRFLLSYYQLPDSTSNTVLFDNLNDLFDKIDLVNQVKNETEALKYRLAALMVNEAHRSGALKQEDKEVYTRLAVADFDTTKEVIYATHSNSLELDELIKLSGYQLYMSGKLERLKELSEDYFKLKLKELNNHDFRNLKNHVDISPTEEVEDLMKLSSEQLYYEDGKMERLKVLNFNHFKLMYKEIFRVDYKV